MKIYAFKGIVHPVSSKLTLPEFKQQLGSMDTGETTGEMAVKVTDSVFIARVALYKDVDNLGTFAYSYETMFQSYILAESYVSGKEYNLELTEVVDEGTGEITNFRHVANILENNKEKRPFSASEVLATLHKSKHVHRMLGSLNSAIGNPRESALNCYIALECVRQHFVQTSDGDNKKLSWERMRGSLNIDQSYFDKIKGYADYVRHGEVLSYQPEDRDHFLERTWNVVDRFLIYLDAEATKLDVNRYPLLT